jgi:hypothetical protein
MLMEMETARSIPMICCTGVDFMVEQRALLAQDKPT